MHRCPEWCHTADGSLELRWKTWIKGGEERKQSICLMGIPCEERGPAVPVQLYSFLYVTSQLRRPTKMSPLLPWPPPPESTGHTPKDTRAPQQAISAWASHRVRGRRVLVMWFLKRSLGDLTFPCVSGSPPHMCRPYPSYQAMTPSLMWEAIKEAAGAGFIAWRAPVCWEACRNCVFTVSVWGCGQG